MLFQDFSNKNLILILGAKPEDLKEIHVLSLDGGGSRGIMESIMLGHIMNLATIMKENPEEIRYRPHNLLLIENHPNPIHPTDAFQYIVGELVVCLNFTNTIKFPRVSIVFFAKTLTQLYSKILLEKNVQKMFLFFYLHFT